MPNLTNTQSLRSIHGPGGKIEKRLARASLLAFTRIARTVTISELAVALGSGDVKKAQRLYPLTVIKEKLQPSARIVEDAFREGGKIGARVLNRAWKGGRK